MSLIYKKIILKFYDINRVLIIYDLYWYHIKHIRKFFYEKTQYIINPTLLRSCNHHLIIGHGCGKR